jgi:hypothetical protein
LGVQVVLLIDISGTVLVLLVIFNRGTLLSSFAIFISAPAFD